MRVKRSEMKRENRTGKLGLTRGKERGKEGKRGILREKEREKEGKRRG